MWAINRVGLYAMGNSYVNVIMSKGSDVSALDYGQIVGATKAGYSISPLLNLLDFHVSNHHRHIPQLREIW